MAATRLVGVDGQLLVWLLPPLSRLNCWRKSGCRQGGGALGFRRRRCESQSELDKGRSQTQDPLIEQLLRTARCSRPAHARQKISGRPCTFYSACERHPRRRPRNRVVPRFPHPTARPVSTARSSRSRRGVAVPWPPWSRKRGVLEPQCSCLRKNGRNVMC